jgi:3-phenylpropionate/trans-cinnamate dioxygenase ferredoxin reductase subunit
MKKTCKVTLNKDSSFPAKCGDLLLDAALINDVDLPHDCRSGICGACRVRLVKGRVFGGQEHGDEMINACQARIISDVEIATEGVPERLSLSARVARIARLSPDVFGMDLELPNEFRYLPGQYCKLQFQGFPVRNYSPTYPLEGAPNPRLMHFQIRKFPDGHVSSELGGAIRAGHRVRLTGPFGSAFFRPNHPGGIVLASSGTGFAPMWSVAVAAIMERPERELIFIVAARNLDSFYMHPALCRLARFPNVTIIPTVSEPQNVSAAVRIGRPTDHLPVLSPEDVVYVSGAPAMTEQVAEIAQAAGAKCYADPFVSNETSNGQNKLVDTFDRLARSPRRALSKVASRFAAA